MCPYVAPGSSSLEGGGLRSVSEQDGGCIRNNVQGPGSVRQLLPESNSI
jgi:hypothetical protein